jgi:hypothetical protein
VSECTIKPISVCPPNTVPEFFLITAVFFDYKKILQSLVELFFILLFYELKWYDIAKGRLK